MLCGYPYKRESRIGKPLPLREGGGEGFWRKLLTPSNLPREGEAK